MRIGVWELVLILAVVLLLFGGTRLAGIGKSLGRGVREFKEELHADDDQAEAAKQKEEAVKAEVKADAEKKDGQA